MRRPHFRWPLRGVRVVDAPVLLQPGDDGPDPDNAARNRAELARHAAAKPVDVQPQDSPMAGRFESPRGVVPAALARVRVLRLSACESDRHLIDAIAADRDRLERVNDRLRGEIAELRAKLAAS